MNEEEIEELKDFTIDITDIDELALGLEVCSKKSNMVIQEFADTIIQLQQENKQLKERRNIMKKETIKELKQLINKAYNMSNDSRISLYIRVMEILDYYDENITIERKMQIKKEYGIGDDDCE